MVSQCLISWWSLDSPITQRYTIWPWQSCDWGEAGLLWTVASLPERKVKTGVYWWHSASNWEWTTRMKWSESKSACHRTNPKANPGARWRDIMCNYSLAKEAPRQPREHRDSLMFVYVFSVARPRAESAVSITQELQKAGKPQQLLAPEQVESGLLAVSQPRIHFPFC